MIWDTIIWLFGNGYELYLFASMIIFLPLAFYAYRRSVGKKNDTVNGNLILTNFDKLNTKLNEMKKVAKEIDETYYSIYIDVENRKEYISKLQGKISTLSEKEKELNLNIGALKDVRVESIDYIGKMIKQSNLEADKKSAKRDTLFFLLGIVFTVLFSIISEVVKRLFFEK